jgi:hypothetical protein
MGTHDTDGDGSDQPLLDVIKHVLSLLEMEGVPTEVNDKIVKLIEDWERQEESTP